MGGILETAMLICFGCSWPINLVKNYKCRSAKGMSLPFILLLMVGYIAGISAKFILGVNVHNAYVLVVYLLNLAMVTANLFVYFRNCALDRKAELCAEPEADDTAMDLMAASVAEQVQQRSKERTTRSVPRQQETPLCWTISSGARPSKNNEIPLPWRPPLSPTRIFDAAVSDILSRKLVCFSTDQLFLAYLHFHAMEFVICFSQKIVYIVH